MLYFYRYGLSEMVSEPLLTEPHYLQLRIGSSFKTGDTTHFEVVRIAPNDIPGRLIYCFLLLMIISNSDK